MAKIVVKPSRTYICQADGCKMDLKDGQKYYKRHKVCVPHAKSAVILVNNVEKRFCQQCSKLHDLSLFDEAKKSSKESLAGHNARRRKATTKENDIVVTELVRPVAIAPCPAVAQNYAAVAGPRFSMAREFFDLNQMILQNNFPNTNLMNQFNTNPTSNSILTNPMLPPRTPVQQTITLQMFPGMTKPPFCLI